MKQRTFLLFPDIFEKKLNSKPECCTVEFMLYATLKNQKRVERHSDTTSAGQVAGQDKVQVTVQVDGLAPKKQQLLNFCSIPRSRKEMQIHSELAGRNHFNDAYLWQKENSKKGNTMCFLSIRCPQRAFSYQVHFETVSLFFASMFNKFCIFM